MLRSIHDGAPREKAFGLARNKVAVSRNKDRVFNVHLVNLAG
jgi:hypothetical protein